MPPYQHLLAAIVFDDAGLAVLDRAHVLAQHFGARLSLLHVIEYTPIETGELLMTTPYDVTQQLEEEARGKLLALCRKQNLPEDCAHVSTGTVVTQIEQLVQKQGVDLVIVGHQPRKGLAAWFSHTEDNLVHRAPCDVLALRLR